MRPSASPQAHYAALNGLRIIAALAVVCFHYCPRTVYPSVNALLSSGPTAVGFFFFLSGFVLAQRYSRVDNYVRFWRARAVRIYPMYAVAFLLFTPLAIEKYHSRPGFLVGAAVLNAGMLQAWTPLAQSWNGPSWTLSVEAFLYAIFPMLVRRISRKANVLFYAALAMVPACLTVAYCIHDVTPWHWNGGMENIPVFWVPVFAFGIATGLWRKQYAGRAAILKHALIPAVIALLILAVLWPDNYREMLIAGAAAVPLAIIVVSCTYNQQIANRLLGNRFLDYLGKTSYITYIIQAPLWHYWRGLVNFATHRPLTSVRSGLWTFLLFVPVLLAASVALDRFVDEPTRMWLSRRSRGAEPEQDKSRI